MTEPRSVGPTKYDQMDFTHDLAAVGYEPDQEQLPMRARRSLGHSVLSIIGGAAVASIVVCVIANFGDIKRYIRISTM